MRLFDSQNKLIRGYLHLSYAMAFAVVTLIVNQGVEFAQGRIQTIDLDRTFWMSLGISTTVIMLMLYLHLPKMINRCFTIGRHFGL